MKISLRSIYLLAAIVLSAIGASAFPVDTYAPKSALAEGKWVKISVAESGMHMIPAATLRQWGFSSPERVRIHGYGGAAISDILSAENYIDDLPQVPSVTTQRGLVFYAVGPTQITMTDDGTLSHSVNPYSRLGYYFLTEVAEGAAEALPESGTPRENGGYASSETSYMVVHERELWSPGASGRLMLGEDFNSTRTRVFNVPTPDMADDGNVTLNVSFMAYSNTAMSNLKFTVNGSELPASPSDRIAITNSGTGFWGTLGKTTKRFRASGGALQLGITFENPGVVKAAGLDYFELIYPRSLRGSLDYWTSRSAVVHGGSSDKGAHVWDVTDPLNVSEVRTGTDGAWTSSWAGARHYAVWNESDAMPAPERVGSVANQNLHGITEIPDMVIITPDLYSKASLEIAEIHRNYELDPIKVEVVSLDNILNEFGSGAFDPGALRRYLKMLHDRGLAAGTPLRYALMMGKGVCDNRQLTAVGRGLRAPMPLWVSEASLSESSSYSTDDYFALLDDDDGTRPGRETLNIAVGRIPATGAEEAQVAVNKIRQYLYSMPRDGWRARMTVLADDENEGVHMKDSELMLAAMSRGASGGRIVVNKVYCDAFPRQNSTYPKAKELVFDSFSDGTSIFAFVGHGSPTALGSKIIIGPTEFRENFHLRKLPFFYAATCSFLHWDSDIVSQAETLMFQPTGGIIGCISALRPVYITQNGYLTEAVGKVLAGFGYDGKVPTMGDLYRRAKNLVPNDNNKLRYVLMADPALRLGLPSATVTLDAINGTAVTADEPYMMMARQELEISGRVLNTDGSLMDDFNGTVQAVLYDAEYSTTSRGHGEGEQVTFEQKGDMLFSVCGPAEGGRFTIKVRMPSVLADNYRPATLSLYAAGVDKNDLREAAGLSRNVYAYGYDESAEADTEPPVIHTLMLNGDAFADGGDVNPDPLLIATVSDNTGINLASAGVGRHMSVTIDGSESMSDASRYFTPDATPFSGAMSGTVKYPLSNLEPGEHEVKLRVWDIDGNFADSSIRCNVVAGLAPEIYEVYTDASPARTQASFYVKHNRPDQMMRVKVSVYNLLGAPIWSAESEGRSDMGVSAPITWDLKDSGGKRVPRGIYIYRAEVQTGSSAVSTASRKLAVANE